MKIAWVSGEKHATQKLQIESDFYSSVTTAQTVIRDSG